MPAEEEKALTPEQLAKMAQSEYEQSQKELKEIEILIRQSTGEVEKLAQRNAQLAGKVRQMEVNLETYPRQDIRETYVAIQDTQARLFMMRGQVEQLQGRQQSLERYSGLLRRVLDALEGGGEMPARRSSTASAGGAPTIVRVIEAQENERQHLARQMHDGPAQSLTNLILQAEICERLYDSHPQEARQELAALKRSVSASFQKVRDFIFELRPMMLDDLGVVPTLRRYIQEFGEKHRIAAQFTLLGKERRFSSPAEVTIFRAVQGLLSNVQEHAKATTVQVSLDLQGPMAIVTVEDDGAGFSVGETMSANRQRTAGGLGAMRDQVEMLGGHFQIDSAAGRGTRVVFEVPLE